MLENSRREMELAERVLARERLVWATMCHGAGHLLSGRLPEAAAILERALALARELGEKRVEILIGDLLALGMALAGRDADADEILEEVADRVGRLPNPYLQAESLRTRILVCAVRGRWEEAFELYEQFGRIVEVREEERLIRLITIAPRIEILLALDLHEEAEAAIQEARRLAEIAESPEVGSRARAGHARLLARRGAVDEALHELDEAAATLDSIGARIEAARVRRMRYRVLSDAGRSAEAASERARVDAELREMRALGLLRPAP